MRPSEKLTRRGMLRRSAGGLLAAGLWPGALASREPATGSFHFLVVNDTHYLTDKCGPWLEKVVEQMRAHSEKIEFCLLAGDLSHNGTPKQLEPLREIFNGLKKPVHVVVGNHDHRSVKDRKPYEDAFPNSVNYRFDHGGWQFIGLDTSEGTNSYVNVQPHTLRWLDDTLPKLDKHRPTVVFTHFPFGWLVPYRIKNADAVLDRFKELNLQAIYSGHFHGFTERHKEKTTITTNKCCSFSRPNHDGTKEKGYFLCHARDGKLERKFVEVGKG